MSDQGGLRAEFSKICQSSGQAVAYRKLQDIMDNMDALEQDLREVGVFSSDGKRFWKGVDNSGTLGLEYYDSSEYHRFANLRVLDDGRIYYNNGKGQDGKSFTQGAFSSLDALLADRIVETLPKQMLMTVFNTWPGIDRSKEEPLAVAEKIRKDGEDNVRDKIRRMNARKLGEGEKEETPERKRPDVRIEKFRM